MYESLLLCCEENELFAEASQIFSDMRFYGVEPSDHLYRSMVVTYCKMGFPETAHYLIDQAEEKGLLFDDVSIHTGVIEAYGKLKLWQKAESLVGSLRQKCTMVDRKVWNALIHAYAASGCYERARAIFNTMMRDGPSPTVDSVNGLMQALIVDGRLDELYVVIQELQDMGFKIRNEGCRLFPTMHLYRIMIGLLAKGKRVRDVEAMVSEMEVADSSPTFLYGILNSGNHSKAEKLLGVMKEAGVEPTIATMHLLMVSYSGSGQPEEAEKVLDNLKVEGLPLSTLPYSSVIDAYLKNGDHNVAIQKLMEMKKDGLEPDHRIWTCFVRAASLSQHTSEAIVLLKALRDTGFDLPIRLLTEKSDSLVSEVDNCLEKLGPLEDNAAFNFVNALEDLLWAFELRATASWVFQLAVKRSIYRHDVFRVAEKDWGADFRKMSAGSALVGLTCGLTTCRQDASLQGYPLSPKSVVLITGTAEYNMVSLNSTLKAFLWEMGSPFLPCKTRSGLLVAKAHSLRMWLKDSSFCLDLELKDAPSLPESNSMQLMEGVFPKTWPYEKRDKVIRADIEGGKEKLEKMKKKVGVKRRRKLVRRKFIRGVVLSKPVEIR
ncbi:Pentatricopeptide repeat-containing protein, chloroplastic [Vitis vinifera]|uniref:Pentatricopeptide repeat-containing protein, chloroplastic n=1 Tax=Vitis vinifera TaxID=29760 RepID=A0A438E2C4_VITVI|nr:Pentatricopeptide repeat-containing protein, chloroplastic [Vitis vinifera]